MHEYHEQGDNSGPSSDGVGWKTYSGIQFTSYLDKLKVIPMSVFVLFCFQGTAKSLQLFWDESLTLLK